MFELPKQPHKLPALKFDDCKFLPCILFNLANTFFSTLKQNVKQESSEFGFDFIPNQKSETWWIVGIKVIKPCLIKELTLSTYAGFDLDRNVMKLNNFKEFLFAKTLV